MQEGELLEKKGMRKWVPAVRWLDRKRSKCLVHPCLKNRANDREAGRGARGGHLGEIVPCALTVPGSEK